MEAELACDVAVEALLLLLFADNKDSDAFVVAVDAWLVEVVAFVIEVSRADSLEFLAATLATRLVSLAVADEAEFDAESAAAV